jgi:hypothetical protein
MWPGLSIGATAAIIFAVKIDPYDQERREFLHRRMTELCVGTDQELSRLKRKYRNDKRVWSKLNEYEERIELSRGK